MCAARAGWIRWRWRAHAWPAAHACCSCARRPESSAAISRARRFARRAWRGRSTPCVIVNDRADIARLSGARGVHVGQDDLRSCGCAQRRGDPRRRRPVHARRAADGRGARQRGDLRRGRSGLRDVDEGHRLLRARARPAPATPRAAASRSWRSAASRSTGRRASSPPAPRGSRSSPTCSPGTIPKRARGEFMARLACSRRTSRTREPNLVEP